MLQLYIAIRGPFRGHRADDQPYPSVDDAAQAVAITKLMQSVGRHYMRYVNDHSHRSGTLWEGRYKASLVDCERYVLACYRSIELKPVRAGMVSNPADYRWSS